MNVHAIETFFVAKTEAEPETLSELSRVRAVTEISEAGTVVPQGATGTIMSVHQKSGTYEVEFTSPVQAVVGATRAEIEPV